MANNDVCYKRVSLQLEREVGVMLLSGGIYSEKVQKLEKG